MKNICIAFFLLFLFVTGCALKNSTSGVVYTRTKDLKVNGRISVSKGDTLFSVTWKYAKQNIYRNAMKPSEELQDCFSSEVVFDGKKEDRILFLVKNYLCGTRTPVNIEPVELNKPLPAQITFHSNRLTILSADSTELVFESR